jgi:hypothetical protein
MIFGPFCKCLMDRNYPECAERFLHENIVYNNFSRGNSSTVIRWISTLSVFLPHLTINTMNFCSYLMLLFVNVQKVAFDVEAEEAHMVALRKGLAQGDEIVYRGNYGREGTEMLERMAAKQGLFRYYTMNG